VGKWLCSNSRRWGLTGMPGDQRGGWSWDHPSCALFSLHHGGDGRPLWHIPASSPGSRLSCGSGEGSLQGQESWLRPKAFPRLSFKAVSLQPQVPCVRKHSGTQGKENFCPGSCTRMCEPRECWRQHLSTSGRTITCKLGIERAPFLAVQRLSRGCLG